MGAYRSCHSTEPTSSLVRGSLPGRGDRTVYLLLSESIPDLLCSVREWR